MNTHRMLPLLSAVALAGACTRPADVAAVPTLEEAARVTAQGTRPRSEIDMTRIGALDPAGSALTIMVNDAAIELRSDGQNVTIDKLDLRLDSTDLPPSADLPNGLKLRDTHLSLDAPVRAPATLVDVDTLVVQVTTPLSLHASLLLTDGSLYPLGAQPTETGMLEVRVATDQDTANVILHAGPADECWHVDYLLSARNCSLYVEAPAHVTRL